VAKEGVVSAMAASAAELKALPGQIDYLLRRMAGEGNDILFWFLRVVTVLLVTGTAFLIASAVFKFATSISLSQPTTQEEPSSSGELPTQPQPPSRVGSPAPTAPAVAVTNAVVRVKVWDDTKNRPIDDKAEIWFQQHGSWWLKPDLQHGAAAKDLGRRQVDKLFTGNDGIVIYPDGRQPDSKGRDSQRIVVPFKMTTGMNPDGSDRDSIMIIIGDDVIEIVGLPVKAATGEPTMEIPRRPGI